MIDYSVREVGDQWQWIIKTDFPTHGFGSALFGMMYSAEDAMWQAIRIGNQLNTWYWEQQQMELDFGLE